MFIGFVPLFPDDGKAQVFCPAKIRFQSGFHDNPGVLLKQSAAAQAGECLLLQSQAVRRIQKNRVKAPALLA